MKLSSYHIYLLLPGIALLVYLNSLSGTFLFDDYAVIVGYAPVHDLSGWLGDLGHGIRPILKLTYMMNWTSGMGAAGFHLFNTLVHGINTLLVYILGDKLWSRWSKAPSGSNWITPPLLVALLFAVHPVQTEAVTYISGRSSSLMSLFYLGALLSYIRGTETDDRKWLYIASPLLFLLAADSKETALSLPFVLFLWDRTVRSERLPVFFKREAVHWTMFVLLLMATTFHHRYARLLWISMDTRSLHDNLLSQINGLSYLLSRLVCFHRLNIDPDLPVISGWDPVLILQLSALLGVTIMAFIFRKRRPWLWFGALWFVILLMPTNSFLPRYDIANERHIYLAGFGLFFPLSMELSSLGIMDKKWSRIGIVSLLAILALFTVKRNSVYKDNVTLWEDTALKSPNSTRVFNNLGYSYELAGRRSKAVAMYERALSLNPDNVFARRNLARIKGD